MPEDFGLIIGDAIHNLHSALDFAWIEAVSTFATPSATTKFPIRDTRDEVVGAVKGRKIPEASKAIGEFIVDVVKPYKGGNDPVWAIHDLDIADKHWDLIPSFKMTAVWDIRVESDRGEETIPSVIPAWIVTHGRESPAIYTMWGCRNTKVADNGKAALLIDFAQGPLEGKSVLPTLTKFVEATTEVIEGFRDLFATIQYFGVHALLYRMPRISHRL